MAKMRGGNKGVKGRLQFGNKVSMNLVMVTENKGKSIEGEFGIFQKKVL